MKTPFGFGVFVALLICGAALFGQTLKCTCTVFDAVVTPTVSLGNGSAGSPALFFTSDATHGLYHVSSALFGLSASLEAGTDATYDIGTTSANRFRNGFFSAVLAAAKVQVGAGATSTSNITMRNSDAAGMLSIALGNESDYGDIGFRRMTSNNTGSIDTTFTTGFFWNGNYAYSGGNPAGQLAGLAFKVNPIPTQNVTQNVLSGFFELNTVSTHNYTGLDTDALYGLNLPAGSGNYTTELAGVVGDAEFSGTGTAATVFAVKGYCCSFDPGAGSLGVITNSGFFHATQPFTGATPPATNRALWIEDQTAGGSFTPSVANYAVHIGTPSATHDDIVSALGLTGLYGAAPNALSPLRVGGTYSSVLVNAGNSGTAKTLDLSLGNVQRVTLTGNVTFTLTNPVDGGQYTLEIYTGAGGFTVAWPAAVKWPSATAPTITVTAARMDMVRCTYDATASDYFCQFSGSTVYTP